MTTFIKAFRAACTKAGCPGRIPHDLRRTAVRNLVRAGVPERVAMQMTGHKTRSVFERYNILSECDLVEAAKKLNAMQPVPPASNRDGHNSGTVSPDRGSRLRFGDSASDGAPIHDGGRQSDLFWLLDARECSRQRQPQQQEQ